MKKINGNGFEKLVRISSVLCRSSELIKKMGGGGEEDFLRSFERN